MSFYDEVDSPIGSEDLFIFNTELLSSRAGIPFFRFDLGIANGGSAVLIRQMRVSGGLIRPPQIRLGFRKINQVLLSSEVASRLWNLLDYVLEEWHLKETLKFTKSERMATSRIRLRRKHLEKLEIGRK